MSRQLLKHLLLTSHEAKQIARGGVTKMLLARSPVRGDGKVPEQHLRHKEIVLLTILLCVCRVRLNRDGEVFLYFLSTLYVPLADTMHRAAALVVSYPLLFCWRSFERSSCDPWRG